MKLRRQNYCIILEGTLVIVFMYGFLIIYNILAIDMTLGCWWTGAGYGAIVPARVVAAIRSGGTFLYRVELEAAWTNWPFLSVLWVS